VPKKKVADVVIESLIAAGVKRVYGISGDSLNGITDSIREHDKDISWVHLRHEESYCCLRWELRTRKHASR
jgi:pyruvate dehydrogenase (quinone)